MWISVYEENCGGAAGQPGKGERGPRNLHTGTAVQFRFPRSPFYLPPAGLSLQQMDTEAFLGLLFHMNKGTERFLPVSHPFNCFKKNPAKLASFATENDSKNKLPTQIQNQTVRECCDCVAKIVWIWDVKMSGDKILHQTINESVLIWQIFAVKSVCSVFLMFRYKSRRRQKHWFSCSKSIRVGALFCWLSLEFSCMKIAKTLHQEEEWHSQRQWVVFASWLLFEFCHFSGKRISLSRKMYTECFLPCGWEE